MLGGVFIAILFLVGGFVLLRWFLSANGQPKGTHHFLS